MLTCRLRLTQPKQKRHLVRTLGKSLREYRKPSILTPIFVVVEGVLEILIPTVMASLIDEGITGKSMPAIVKFGLILLACSLCSLAAGFLAGKFAAIAGAGFAKNLRHDEFEKVQGFSFTNIDKFSTGSIITRLTTDVTNLQNAYSMIIRLGVRAPIMMIVAWIFSFRISPSISLVFLACIPVLAFGLCGLAVYVHPVFERVFHTYDKLNNVVDENLQGIRVVKSYTRESHEIAKFGRISQRIYKDFSKADHGVQQLKALFFVEILEILRDFTIGDLKALGFFFEADGAAIDEVDNAVELVFRTDRDLEADGLRLQAVADHVHAAEEVGADAVHLVDEADTGHAVTVGLAPHGFRLGLHACHAAEHHDGAVKHAERTFHFSGEVNVPGSINNVQLEIFAFEHFADTFILHLLPVGGNSSGGNGDTAFAFLLHPVGRGGTVMGFTNLVNHAGVEKDTLGQRGFAGVNVSGNTDIAVTLKGSLAIRIIYVIGHSVWKVSVVIESE